MAFGGALWESRQEAADWMVSPLASSLGVEQEAADWMVSPPASSLGVEAGGSRLDGKKPSSLLPGSRGRRQPTYIYYRYTYNII